MAEEPVRAPAPAAVKTIAPPMGYATDNNDGDGDDAPVSNGSADGHADCVPGIE